MPAKLTAHTGMDAMTHAIEAYVSTLNCEYTDPLALHAIELIHDNLKKSYEGDMACRDKMHDAQCLAGMAFSNALLGIVPHSVTYVGKGKLEEIKEYIRNEEEAEREIGMVIFDDELSAKQIRNIEAELKIKILDRTSLILDIFAMRAQTANAKTQVELAQYKYMLPRLQRLWTHLERQGGGSGAGGGKGSVGLRGPGETQLEMDRRIILNRMSLLKERLAEIDKQKSTQRKNRGRMIRAALVGYTNVGKSTLMNLLAKSEVFAENKLFATLDTTVRKVIIDNLPFLLSDTVGFIRKLPTASNT